MMNCFFLHSPFTIFRYAQGRLHLNKTKNTSIFCFVFGLHYLCTNMDTNSKLQIEEGIIRMLKTVYDPEIPVDVYELGLVYKIDVDDNGHVAIDMTLTAPNCPAADFIFEDVRMKVESVEGVTSVDINLVFEPEWNQEMMSEEAKLELGFL